MSTRNTAGSTMRFMVILSCTHEVELTVTRPDIGALQFCYSCDDWRQVQQYPSFYRGRCMAEYKGRELCFERLRVSEQVVRKAIETHGKHCPDHKIELSHFDNMNTRTTIGYYVHLNGWDNEPESFGAIAKRAQSLLRDARNTDSDVSQEPARQLF